MPPFVPRPIDRSNLRRPTELPRIARPSGAAAPIRPTQNRTAGCRAALRPLPMLSGTVPHPDVHRVAVRAAPDIPVPSLPIRRERANLPGEETVDIDPPLQVGHRAEHP